MQIRRSKHVVDIGRPEFSEPDCAAASCRLRRERILRVRIRTLALTWSPRLENGASLARKISSQARRSVRPCVRPVCATRAPLAIMLSADQIPIKSTRLNALWDEWVRLVPGSTGQHDFVICPFQPRYARPARLCSLQAGLAISLRPGHQRPDHSRNLVRQSYSRDFHRAALEEFHEPRPLAAVPLCIAMATKSMRLTLAVGSMSTKRSMSLAARASPRAAEPNNATCSTPRRRSSPSFAASVAMISAQFI